MLAAGTVETRKVDGRQLSDRELKVFRLMGSGLGTSRVATELQVSVKTVETHQSHIKQKLGLHTVVELHQRATRGLLNATRREQRIRD
jgi:DNA-binding NarL/FixJ family response regulator